MYHWGSKLKLLDVFFVLISVRWDEKGPTLEERKKTCIQVFKVYKCTVSKV